MNISCKIAEDLLPLYADGSCSEDSQAALEEHLKGCPACRAKLDRMQSDLTDDVHVEKAAPKLANYAKKVRNHRIRMAALVVLVIVIASAVLSLGYLTLRDMYYEASPTIHTVEMGTYNLTGSSLETTAEEVEQYIFFTNYTQIEVTVQGSNSVQGTVMLWNAANSDSFIQIHNVNENTAICTFTGLSASNRYRITCGGLDGAAVTVSEGRHISFWRSLGSVLNEIARAIF